MMRDIKCRGKWVNNGEWVYGYYAKDINHCIDGKEYIDCIINTQKDNAEGMWFEVIPETVGQFTGLPDKNGSEIYEGDIVRHKQFAIYGILSECVGTVKIDPHNGVMVGYDSIGKNIEVIGNLHDNLELLGVSP